MNEAKVRGYLKEFVNNSSEISRLVPSGYSIKIDLRLMQLTSN